MPSSNALEPPPGSEFGELLDWHLRRGTRPLGSEKQGEFWKKAAFADDLGVSDKQVRNWVSNKSLPNNTITIERVLFGRDQSHRVAWRMELRDALKRTRSGKASSGRTHVVKQLKEQTFDYRRLPETFYVHLVGREAELRHLDEAQLNPRVNIVSLIAEGGAGKSALLNEWLKRLQADNYRGAEAVLGWSFYNQGTKERATSADEFLDWALGKLGISIETTSNSAKGDAIAEVIMGRRVLLVLDGVEPLQYGPGAQVGELKDLGLRALLRRFSTTPPAAAHGLIVLTSRVAVKNIARWVDNAAPVIKVERLSEEAGAALLRENGASGSDTELRDAAHDFGGQPLALSLLASFLKETQSGDVRRRDHIRNPLAEADNSGYDHAKRVMESIEKEWLVGHPVLLAIMHMVGLFDRPANRRCLFALRKPNVIEGLTDSIVNLNDIIWQRAISRLREVRLLAPKNLSSPDELDAHPIVREWFGERLRNLRPSAWYLAHSRLYEHLRDATKEGKHPTLSELSPLYQAIIHGCRAKRYNEALIEILVVRIFREKLNREQSAYATSQLGAFGTTLAAMSWFFEQPYQKLVPDLDEGLRLWLFHQAGILLRATGRLGEAKEALSQAVRIGKERKDWERASVSGDALASLEVVSGDLESALDTISVSVGLSSRIPQLGKVPDIVSYYHAMAPHLTRGYVLFMAGKAEQAASVMTALGPDPGFQSVLAFDEQGNWYIDLLLAKAQWNTVQDVLERLSMESRPTSLLERAFPELARGRSFLGLALASTDAGEMRTNGSKAVFHLHQAIEHLRRASVAEQLPRGLLARSALFRSMGQWDAAARDLEEASEIAEPGPMQIHLCDVALERARLMFARCEGFAPTNALLDRDHGNRPALRGAEEIRNLMKEAENQIVIGADYIERCGYHRRDEELAELRAVLRGECAFSSLRGRV
jgi:tetratricopeptide (TPR) repeat protein